MTKLLLKKPPTWAISDDVQFPAWIGAPRQYRFDGQDGVFLVGQDRLELITAQFFDWRWQHGLRWGRPAQTWLDLAFVDNDGVVSQLSVKKDSALYLFEALVSLRLDEVSLYPEAVRIPLALDRRSIEIEDEGRTQDYWVVLPQSEVEYVAESEFRKVQEFKESGVFKWIVVGENEEA